MNIHSRSLVLAVVLEPRYISSVIPSRAPIVAHTTVVARRSSIPTGYAGFSHDNHIVRVQAPNGTTLCRMHSGVTGGAAYLTITCRNFIWRSVALDKEIENRVVLLYNSYSIIS